MTHFGSQHYLSLIDCSPHRFAICWLLLWPGLCQHHLAIGKCILCQRTACELLTDEHHSILGRDLHKICSYNGIVKRSHCTIKHITTRSQCSVMEAVYWYMSLKDDITASTAPANAVHMYQACIKIIDVALSCEHTNPWIYKVGDAVWVKSLHGGCSTQFKKGMVTGVDSPHSVLANRALHLRDLCSWERSTSLEDDTVMCRLRVSQMCCSFSV